MNNALKQKYILDGIIARTPEQTHPGRIYKHDDYTRDTYWANGKQMITKMGWMSVMRQLLYKEFKANS